MKNTQAKYRSGYKYQLAEEFVAQIDFELGHVHRNGLIITDIEDVDEFAWVADGLIKVRKGYAWDGATCAPDWEWVMIPALVHDTLYQLIRENYLPQDRRRDVDVVFLELMVERKPRSVMPYLFYFAVRWFGKKAAMPKSARPVWVAE